METKKTGLSPDLIIHPGETVSDIIIDRGISQAELAVCTGMTPAYISNVLSGKKRISSRFAMALEYALDVPKTFWLNLQANYDAELLEAQEDSTITEEECNVRKKLGDVITYLNKNESTKIARREKESILSLRRVLRISNLSNLEKCVPDSKENTTILERIDKHVLGAWIKICHMISFDKSSSVPFQKDSYDSLAQKMSEIEKLNTIDTTAASEMLSEHGVTYSFIESFPKAKVDGYIIQNNNGSYFIAVTEKSNHPEQRLRSIMKELDHVVNGDMSHTSRYLDLGNKKS